MTLIERLHQERPIEKMFLLQRFGRGPETAVWEVMTTHNGLGWIVGYT